ncbi:hypothetical protein GCM10008106_16760 [Mongoliitalea lutea]|uniref:Uncharacterized protein n=1 Tax=Mongoliitalea lutea TaxID=849756 RepID=A0A8J3CXM1_9BACT|nr:hypothetical protein GCM10008106_16760 [Mongoliitalea lutea]
MGVIGICVALAACNQKGSIYEYNEGLVLYLKQLPLDVNQNQSIVLIPIGGCYNCIGPALDYLQDSDPSVDLVIFTSTIQVELKRQSNIVFDQDGNFKQYETGVFSPVAFELRSGVVENLVDLNSSSKEEFKILIDKALDK